MSHAYREQIERNSIRRSFSLLKLGLIKLYKLRREERSFHPVSTLVRASFFSTPFNRLSSDRRTFTESWIRARWHVQDRRVSETRLERSEEKGGRNWIAILIGSLWCSNHRCVHFHRVVFPPGLDIFHANGCEVKQLSLVRHGHLNAPSRDEQCKYFVVAIHGCLHGLPFRVKCDRT